ncbi:MAG: hypothetical protein JO046_18455 [Solirubrobacterales bacterium]|nr:hypothetical protein [Solirubrobacterales bacterium]
MFASLLDYGKDCNAAHIADLFDPSNGLADASTPHQHVLEDVCECMD